MKYGLVIGYRESISQQFEQICAIGLRSLLQGEFVFYRVIYWELFKKMVVVVSKFSQLFLQLKYLKAFKV